MDHRIECLDQVFKRLFDILVATTGLILLSPLFLVIGLAIKVHDAGPILYRAVRVGRDGRLFQLFKFRTMIVGADCQGPAITSNCDMRITSIGRWLRRTKLDELPQLFNVLIGDMSLVGPRPEDPRYVALYTLEQQCVLRVCPGITSAASIVYRNEEQVLSGADWERMYRDEVMPAKLAIDLQYLSQRTLMTDIALILRTLIVVFR
jgi:lipopolysaccharide/colanic/teichoic acid biosynthesis glycosyltransferase